MNLFTFKANEHDVLDAFLHENLKTTVQFSLKSNEDNFLIYIVKDRIAALATIVFEKETNNAFYYKVDVRHITEPEKRISVFFKMAKFQNENLDIDLFETQNIINSIYESTYSFPYYLNNAEDLLIREKNKLKNKTQKIKQTADSNLLLEDISYKNISEPHIKAQYILKYLGDFIDLDTFIAKNDQYKVFNKELLGTGTIQEIPYTNISKEAINIISLIDVIWFKNSVPQAAFEIETTTSISSGLLRFSDLIYTLNIPVDLYIVTTRDREKKLKKELNRSIFKSTGISHRCKVIFLDDLETLYKMIKPLNGYIKSNILDRISLDFSYFEDNG